MAQFDVDGSSLVDHRFGNGDTENAKTDDGLAAHALGVVEILAIVLGLVDEPGDLARCARVNRQWYLESIPILWRGDPDPEINAVAWSTPDIEFLIRLAEKPKRFRHYISHIKFLHLYSLVDLTPTPMSLPEILMDPDLWTTARLLSVVSHFEIPNIPDSFISSILGPTARSIVFHGCVDSPTFLSDLQVCIPRCSPRLLRLKQIQRKCPQLECFSSYLSKWSDQAIYGESLTEYVANNPQLKVLHLQGMKMSEVCVYEVLRLQHLVCLHTDGPIPDYFYHRVQTPPFPNLRVLCLSNTLGPPLARILSQLTKLERLHVWFRISERADLSRDIIEPLSSCAGLISLVICSARIARSCIVNDVRSETLLAFAKACPLLKQFVLMYQSDSPPWSSEAICNLSQFEFLEELVILHPCDITVYDLAVLGGGCSNLTVLGLNAIIDLSKLEEHMQHPASNNSDSIDHAKTFNCLTSLSIGHSSGEADERRPWQDHDPRLAASLKVCFPQLRTLNSNDLAKRLLHAMFSYRGPVDLTWIKKRDWLTLCVKETLSSRDQH